MVPALIGGLGIPFFTPRVESERVLTCGPVAWPVMREHVVEVTIGFELWIWYIHIIW